MIDLSRLRNVLPARYQGGASSALLTARTASARARRRVFPKRYPPGPELRVHLGCGSIDHPSFVNVDGMPYNHVHHVGPIDDLPQFATESVSLVYACHCLEHFCMRDVPRVLQEWRRILRPGGILRLSVPDFDLLLAIYEQHDRDISTIDEVLVGGQRTIFDRHGAVFTKRSLARLLEVAGLHDVREWVPGSDPLTTFNDWSGRHIPVGEAHHPISLNLEAVR